MTTPPRITLAHGFEQPAWIDEVGERPRGRRWLTAAAVALATFLAAVVWLFGSAPPELQRPTNVDSLPSVDGTLVVVESDRLVLEAFKPVGGEDELEFTIRPQDRSHFDIAHLRSHSSIALPTRLFYEREGGSLFAVYKEDAPANSAREAGDGR